MSDLQCTVIISSEVKLKKKHQFGWERVIVLYDKQDYELFLPFIHFSGSRNCMLQEKVQ